MAQHQEAGSLIKTASPCAKTPASNTSAANIGFVFAMSGAYVVCAIWCGWGILQGALSYGTFVAVVQLVSQVQSPFANISGYLPRFYAMTASAERLMEAEGFGEEESERLTGDEARQLYRSIAAIGMEDVTFDYEVADAAAGADAADPDEDAATPHRRTSALADCTFQVEKGSLVALAGPSGCGKSTALRLLLALYPPTIGECYLMMDDGQRVALTPKYRALFAYVPQGNCLLSGTIRQALAFGSEDLAQDDDRLWHALEVACAAKFVRELPDGLDTMLGERGAGLSEGQIQRIAIARALVTRRPILMLDECTSSLDAPTELQVLQNLAKLEDITVLAVTHRHQTLEAADKIVEFSRED